MKIVILFAIVACCFLQGCKTCPLFPTHPITYTTIPQDSVTLIGHWKMGEFVISYRIMTDAYVIASDMSGLFGQSGSLVGPGLVNHVLNASFAPIAWASRDSKEHRIPMTFYGELVHLPGQKDPYLFEGKPVIFPMTATYNDRTYATDRSERCVY